MPKQTIYTIRMLKSCVAGGGHLIHQGDILTVTKDTLDYFNEEGKEPYAKVIEIDGERVSDKAPQEVTEAVENKAADVVIETGVNVKADPPPFVQQPAVVNKSKR